MTFEEKLKSFEKNFPSMKNWDWTYQLVDFFPDLEKVVIDKQRVKEVLTSKIRNFSGQSGRAISNTALLNAQIDSIIKELGL